MFKLPIFRKKNKSEVGLIINWEFHKNNQWVSALTHYLVDGIVQEFNPVLIQNQADYDKHKKNLKKIISMEPGWAAPNITIDCEINSNKLVFYSDPHYNTEIRRKYFFDNDFTYVLSYYKSPFFFHFKNFPLEKFIHFPWAIPDQFINIGALGVRNNEVIIFGGKSSDAYNIRNWCREQKGIVNYNNSGVENKKMSDREYFTWLKNFDAIVAAGSSNPIYDLVTPKYFEIASAGALLFGQSCNDLESLGFNDNNAEIFSKENFNEKVEIYKKNPGLYLDKRRAGRDLILNKHKISDRIKLIKDIFYNE